MVVQTDSRQTSAIKIPAIFGGPFGRAGARWRRWFAVGALLCLCFAISVWGALIGARREALAVDRFSLSEVRQDSVLQAFARSSDFSSGLLSFRQTSADGHGSINPLMGGRPERASDLLGTLEEAQDTALELTWVAHLTDRVMKEGASQPLMVVFRHRAPEKLSKPLTVRVAINYDPAAFALSPAQLSKEVVVSPGQEMGSTSWILRPLKAGNHSLAIEALGDVQALGVNVRNILGFSPSVARASGIVASALSFLLSIPWLFELWRLRTTRPVRPPQRSPKRNRRR